MLRLLPVLAVRLQSGRDEPDLDGYEQGLGTLHLWRPLCLRADRGCVQAVQGTLWRPARRAWRRSPWGCDGMGPLSNFVWFFAEEIYVKHFIIQGRGLELLIKWR